MPSILLAWKLASGLGHLVPLRGIGLELVRRAPAGRHRHEQWAAPARKLL